MLRLSCIYSSFLYAELPDADRHPQDISTPPLCRTGRLVLFIRSHNHRLLTLVDVETASSCPERFLSSGVLKHSEPADAHGAKSVNPKPVCVVFGSHVCWQFAF